MPEDLGLLGVLGFIFKGFSSLQGVCRGKLTQKGVWLIHSFRDSLTIFTLG